MSVERLRTLYRRVLYWFQVNLGVCLEDCDVACLGCLGRWKLGVSRRISCYASNTRMKLFTVVSDVGAGIGLRSIGWMLL